MDILIKFEADYADESDVYGFRIMSEEEWESLKNKIENLHYPLEFYFGTNEAMEFNSSQDIMESFTTTQLTSQDSECLFKHFKNYTDKVKFGWDPIDHLIDTAAEQAWEAENDGHGT